MQYSCKQLIKPSFFTMMKNLRFFVIQIFRHFNVIMSFIFIFYELEMKFHGKRAFHRRGVILWFRVNRWDNCMGSRCLLCQITIYRETVQNDEIKRSFCSVISAPDYTHLPIAPATPDIFSSSLKNISLSAWNFNLMPIFNRFFFSRPLYIDFSIQMM